MIKLDKKRTSADGRTRWSWESFQTEKAPLPPARPVANSHRQARLFLCIGQISPVQNGIPWRFFHSSAPRKGSSMLPNMTSAASNSPSELPKSPSATRNSPPAPSKSPSASRKSTSPAPNSPSELPKSPSPRSNSSSAPVAAVYDRRIRSAAVSSGQNPPTGAHRPPLQQALNPGAATSFPLPRHAALRRVAAVANRPCALNQKENKMKKYYLPRSKEGKAAAFENLRDNIAPYVALF